MRHAAALLLLVASPAPAGPRPDPVQARLEALAAKVRPARLGVAIVDLRSGREWSVNGDARFPLQSVFKLPVAIALLAAVESGRIAWEQSITIRDADLSPGNSPIADAFSGPSARFTVRELLRAMLVEGDNTAADALLHLVGGPAAVTAMLRRHGISGFRVDRSELELASDYYGIAATGPGGAAWAKRREAVRPSRQRAAAKAYLDDPRDTASPRAAAQLLQMLAERRILSRASTDVILGLLEETRPGAARLKAGLPAGTRLAHRTGSSDTSDGVTAVTNDIGIATLSNGRTLVLVAFLKGSPASLPQREATLAQVARIATD